MLAITGPDLVRCFRSNSHSLDTILCMQGRDYFVHISRKEGFESLDGAYTSTGNIREEWIPFESYKEAQKSRENALKDDSVIAASIVTDDFRVD